MVVAGWRWCGSSDDEEEEPPPRTTLLAPPAICLCHPSPAGPAACYTK